MEEVMRKRLTIYLGEPWHEILVCPKCGFTSSRRMNFCFCKPPVRVTENGGKNRTFTTPNDMDALRRKLVEKEDWADFHKYARHVFCKDYVTVCGREDMEADFNAWLFDATNGCPLVGEWLERKEGLES